MERKTQVVVSHSLSVPTHPGEAVKPEYPSVALTLLLGRKPREDELDKYFQFSFYGEPRVRDAFCDLVNNHHKAKGPT